MLKKILDFFTGKKPAEPAVAEAPYKVETPAPVAAPEPAKCGCGRSPTGLCVGLHKLSNDEWSKHPDNKTVAVKSEPSKSADDRVEAPAPVKKAPVKKQQFEKKPAASKASPKPRAPAKPRTKKAPQ